MLRPKTAQNTSAGTIGKTPPVGPVRPTSRAPWPSWNTTTSAPNAAADREQVQQHGLHRHEQRAEADEERHERREHDGRDHAAEAALSRGLVVRAEGGQPSHGEPRPGKARDRPGVDTPQVTCEPDARAPVLVLARDHLEQEGLALLGEESSAWRPLGRTPPPGARPACRRWRARRAGCGTSARRRRADRRRAPRRASGSPSSPRPRAPGPRRAGTRRPAARRARRAFPLSRDPARRGPTPSPPAASSRGARRG